MIYTHANFEAGIPAGWTQVSGTWTASASSPLVGTQSLSITDGDGKIILDANSVPSNPSCQMVSKWVSGQYFVGPVICANSTASNCYVMTLEGAENRLHLYKRASGTFTTVAADVFITLVPDASGRILMKLEKSGNTLRGKAWQYGTTEPDWQITATDSTYSSGLCGCRTGAIGGSYTIKADEFWAGQSGDLFTDTTTIDPTDANFLAGLSPLNWSKNSTYVATSVTAASLKIAVAGGTYCELLVDVTGLSSVAAARWPVVAWSVDGGTVQTHQLASEDAEIILASTAFKNIEVYAMGFSPFEDRYAANPPANSIRITGLKINNTGSLITSKSASPILLGFGDSILSGDAALIADGGGRPANDDWAEASDGRASYGFLLAKHYGYQYSNVSYGGYNWTQGLAGVVALSTLSDNVFAGKTRLADGKYEEIPSLVFINLGENSSFTTSDIGAALVVIRSRVNAATPIIVCIPVSGTARSTVTSGYNAYQSAHPDTHAHLIDIGWTSAANYETADDQHPTAAGHQTIFENLVPLLDPIMPTSDGSYDEGYAVGLVDQYAIDQAAVTADSGVFSEAYTILGVQGTKEMGSIVDDLAAILPTPSPIQGRLNGPYLLTNGVTIYPLTVAQNSTHVQDFEYLDGDGDPYVLTGKTCKMVIHSGSTVLYEVENPAVSSNTLTFTIDGTATATAPLKAEYKVWDITEGNKLLSSGRYEVTVAPVGGVQ